MKADEMPLVSVILCFYNEENFLREAVESVIAQSYHDWELILVDDGSSDKSVQIAKDFASEYPDKIFYLDHKNHANKGLSASRNAGIARAKGEYIAFIDADDVWLPVKLSNQLKIFSKYPQLTVVLEASKYWRSWMGPKEKDIVIQVGTKEGIFRAPQLMLELYPLGKGAAPCPSGIMIHRSVTTRCKFEESFRGIYQMYEDQAFLCKVYLNEVVFVSHAFHNKYRQRAASLVSSVHETGKYDTVRRFYLDWFRNYLLLRNYKGQEVLELLEHAQLPYKRPLVHAITVEYPQLLKKLIVKILIRLGLLTYQKSW